MDPEPTGRIARERQAVRAVNWKRQVGAQEMGKVETATNRSGLSIEEMMINDREFRAKIKRAVRWIGKDRRKNMAEKKKNGGRELIDTGTDKRFVRRDDQGQFKESDDVGRSLARDVKQHAKTKVKKGQGDRGDQ